MNKETWQESIIQPMKFRRTDAANSEATSRNPSLTEFDALFSEQWPHIYRLAWRITGDPEEAEDLALEAFYRLYERYPKLTPDFHVAGWLYRVTTNLALQSIRSLKRRETYELNAGQDSLVEASGNQPVEVFNEKEDHRIARRVLSEMKPQQAEILILRYSGWAYKDISRALSLSPASIGPLLLRAEREFERRYRALVEEK